MLQAIQFGTFCVQACHVVTVNNIGRVEVFETKVL